MNDKMFKGQKGIVTPIELIFPISIVGAGGIGSWTVFALAKMGCLSLTVIDFDKVEEHNVPSQLYAPQDVGLSKVDALQKIIRTFTGTVIIPFSGKMQEFVASGLHLGSVVICAVDSMEERKKIWEIVKPMFGEVSLYIDARMGGEQLRVFCISPFNADSIVKYQKNMESVTKVDPTPCTEKTIIYNTFMVGACVASIVKKYAKRQSVDFEYNFDCSNFERV